MHDISLLLSLYWIVLHVFIVGYSNDECYGKAGAKFHKPHKGRDKKNKTKWFGQGLDEIII